ncbi:MAG: glycosyltransferase [Opitutae bacterium]|nr:glycosyltransferase [Opitutae bacterium]
MNENSAYIFDIEEPCRWTFDGEPVWISGWFVSKTGAVFSDIRAVIDGVPHLGIFGLPRENIERQHRGYFGLPHCGFSLRVRPPRGAKLLRLELLDAGQHWVEIWRTKLKVRRGPRPGARLQLELLPAQLERLLQARRADPTGDLRAIAEQLAADIATVPLDTLPNPPFFGALEDPLAFGGSQFGKLRVNGWIIHQEQRITRLLASTHPLVENAMDYGHRERAEAGRLFPDHPSAARSQFFGMVDIDEHVPDPVCLKIFADLEDGTRHLVFVRRFQQRSCTQLEKPRPAFSRATFAEIALIFFAACRRRHIRLGAPGPLWRAGWQAYREFRRDAPPVIIPHTETPYAAWARTNRLTPRLAQTLADAVQQTAAAGGPRFAVLVDTAGCSDPQLRELAASLDAQLFPNWEAWFVGEHCPPLANARCHFERSAGPKDLARALNSAAHQAQATHLALLPGHSRLSPDAFAEIARQLAAQPDLELVYTDEDLMDDRGARSAPKFKPEWSPTLALSGLFPGNLCVVRMNRFVAAGSFRDTFSFVPWFDLLLRVGDQLTTAQVAHLPLVCHHGRASVAPEVDLADPSVEQTRQALAEAARRRGWAATAFLPEIAHHRRLRCHQLRWDEKILTRLQVTIVIPTRDKLHLLQECIELLDETVDWRFVKLVIVDDHSRDADAVNYLGAIQRRNDLLCTVVRPPDPGAPFNYSRLVNAALPHIDTPLVLHLNNDVNALERGWLEEMVGWFTQPDVGVVGAKLVYPEKSLNHTGIIVGPHGGLADTPYAKVFERDVPEIEWHSLAREVSAVTGACLLTRTEIYRALGGFDEADFGVSYNDVDYCLRVRAAGHRVIYTPQAKLMHWGSATRGVTFDEAEHIAFVRRYPSCRDPYCSPHLELRDGKLACRGAVHARPDRAGQLRLLLLTHNLNLEGAPLFLLEYATYLAREAGFHLEVLAAQDGPLRAAYEALGAHITLVDAAPLYAAADEEIFHGRIADIAHQLDWEHIDLVVCNTLVSFWGVHLARRAGKPSMFYIHESSSIFRFFEQKLRLEMHRLVGQAFEQTTAALFLCQATRAYYEDHNLHGNFRLVPSWIRIETMEEFRRTHARAELRRKHGFADHDVVIANIGTVCERKGQHIFIRAVDHFNHHNRGRGPVKFVLVGARPGIYLDLLQGDIAKLGLENLTLVPETNEVFDFFVLADLFVCTSYEESFPRVVMEAMAFRTPIVTTDVHGIADMVRQRAEAYLVAAGDVEGLSRMMRTCLAKERSGKSLTPTAYSKALRYYDYHKVLPRHVALAREAVLAESEPASPNKD